MDVVAFFLLALVASPAAWAQKHEHLLPQQRPWAVPLIRTVACTVAERSVRNYVKPQMVGFDSCANENKFRTSISSDLTKITISGLAYIDEKNVPFAVELLHRYETSFSESGFEVQKITLTNWPPRIELSRPLK